MAALNGPQDSVEVMRKAFEERSRDMIFLRVNQMLVGYRDDPRYVALLERVGHL